MSPNPFAPFLTSILVGVAILLPTAARAEVFELRTYTTNEGRLDALEARFRDHTIALFRKHGMESLGYWVPTDEPRSGNTLIYVLRHTSREAARASWKAFAADPEWTRVAEESQRDGRILAKAPESVFMEATDYSPEYAGGERDGAAVFELRIYHTNAGKLPNLDARFRDHTIGIFARHGMESVGYWHPLDEPAASDTLIYMLRHASREAAAASWQAFGADEEWRKVARESQVDGRILRERPESTYMQATDYSPMQ